MILGHCSPHLTMELTDLFDALQVGNRKIASRFKNPDHFNKARPLFGKCGNDEKQETWSKTFDRKGFSPHWR